MPTSRSKTTTTSNQNEPLMFAIMWLDLFIKADNNSCFSEDEKSYINAARMKFGNGLTPADEKRVLELTAKFFINMGWKPSDLAN